MMNRRQKPDWGGSFDQTAYTRHINAAAVKHAIIAQSRYKHRHGSARLRRLSQARQPSACERRLLPEAARAQSESAVAVNTRARCTSDFCSNRYRRPRRRDRFAPTEIRSIKSVRVVMQTESRSEVGNYTEHSLWLVPEEQLRRRLRSVIEKLARERDAADFEPHVTISSGPSNDDEARTIARAVAARFEPIELTPIKLDYTSEYTRTLFIQFQDCDAARRMFDAINNLSVRKLRNVLNPHLSLLYKTMAIETQAELCRTLEVPSGNYYFDRLRVIETEIPLTTPEPIRRWRTVYECRLAAPQ
jgi:2'-5' RNA ligase